MPYRPSTAPGAAGSPPQRDVTSSPLSWLHNRIRPLHRGVSGLGIQMTARADPTDATGGAGPARGLWVKAPAPGTDPATPDQRADGFWTDELSARPHPETFHCGVWAVGESGDHKITDILDPIRLTRVWVQGAGTVQLLRGNPGDPATLTPLGRVFSDESVAKTGTLYGAGGAAVDPDYPAGLPVGTPAGVQTLALRLAGVGVDATYPYPLTVVLAEG